MWVLPDTARSHSAGVHSLDLWRSACKSQQQCCTWRDTLVRQGRHDGKPCVQETPLVEVPLDAADTAAMESFLSTFDGAASTGMLMSQS